jgi:hypothetical protein
MGDHGQVAAGEVAIRASRSGAKFMQVSCCSSTAMGQIDAQALVQQRLPLLDPADHGP